MNRSAYKATKMMASMGAATLLLSSCVSQAANEERPGVSAAPTRLAVGQAANPADADRTIEIVTLDTMTYDPESITAPQGETILFIVTNEGNLPHEFSLGDEAAQVEHSKEMSDPNMTTHDHPFSVYLEPGETRELAWEFTRAGEFLYGCHVPGHYEAGMKAPLTVE